MFILKSRISKAIEREREKEKLRVEKDMERQMKKLEERLELKYQKEMKNVEDNYRRSLLEKVEEIKRLKREINNHYSIYRDLLKREKQLDDLTIEIEDTVEAMLVRVHESTQPFFRTRAKVESIKRNSNRQNEKIYDIFNAVK